MSDERFFDRLRHDARPLRFEPDAVMAGRIAARIRARLGAPPPTAAQFLERWFRPMTAAFSAIVLVATVSVFWLDRATMEPPSGESLSTSSGIEITAGGEIYSVSE
jgi:hypothetical protein